MQVAIPEDDNKVLKCEPDEMFIVGLCVTMPYMPAAVD